MLIPNLFLAGPPKTGTSSLFQWLSTHPEIEGSKPKETFYLMDNDNPLMNANFNFYKHGWEGYKSFFKNEASIYMDGTTHTMFQKSAMEALKNKKDIKLIFVLRSPEKRIRSSFYYTKNNLARINKSLEFDEYVNKILDGSFGDIESQIEDEASRFVLKRELRYSLYYEYLESWDSIVGRSNIILVYFDKLIQQPERVLFEICTRLGIDPTWFENKKLGSCNKTVTVNNPAMHGKLLRFRKKLNNINIPRPLKDFYLRHFTEPAFNEDDSDSLILLRNYFKAHNDKLKEMCDIDLNN